MKILRKSEPPDNCHPPPPISLKVGKRKIFCSTGMFLSCFLYKQGLVLPPLRTFLISDCVLQDTRKIFCQFYQNYLKLNYWLKVFIFQMSEMWFSWQPKGGCTPPVNSKVFFSDLLAPASRFNTLHGLEN